MVTLPVFHEPLPLALQDCYRFLARNDIFLQLPNFLFELVVFHSQIQHAGISYFLPTTGDGFELILKGVELFSIGDPGLA